MSYVPNTDKSEEYIKKASKNLQFVNKKGKNQKKLIISLFFCIIFLILIIAALIVLYYTLLLKKHDYKNTKNTKENDALNKDNVIEASYKIKEGKEIALFNPEEVGLKNEDYSIEELGILMEEKNNLRFLKMLSVKEGKFIPATSGILKIKILIKLNLNSLDRFFKNNKEIIIVNLTNFNMSNIISMDSTFSGCSNLKEIDFTGVNTSKLTKMKNTFENCTELTNLNLSPLSTEKLVEMENIFLGCKNLEIINLTSFIKINNNTFTGIQSEPNIIANELISKDIYRIFYDLFSIKINIIIGFYNNFGDCIIGEKEKCKSCSKKIKSNCLTCNEGYYLPYHEMDNKYCLTCNIIEHCISCFGEKNYTVCSLCENGFILQDNKCKKEEIEIPICITGENEKCKKCNVEHKLRNECLTCNDGYYLPEDNKTICEKCDLEGCFECFGKKENKLCSTCQAGYELINNKCIKEKCIIGENEKCASCRNEIGKEKICATCNDGYYIPENSYSFTCTKCSIRHCLKCSFEFNKEICLECKENFIYTKNINEQIEECICPSDYRLINDLCLKNENWIEIEVNITDFHKKYQIMNTLYTNINLHEIDLYVNNSIVPITKETSNWDKPIFYKFDKNGLFKIKINIKKNLTSMAWMFTNLNIKSIKFLPGFDSSKVTSMECMFSCSSVESIDMKYLDTSNLLTLNDFLSYSNLITSVDISNFNTSKTYQMRGMFKSNYKLKEIDLSSFDTSKVENCLVMFHDFPTDCIIKISNKFTKCREQISYENKIINIDDLSCNNFENCEKCKGSKETLLCIKCKKGYQLLNDKCIKPKCDIGENEKCLSCQNIIDKEKECLECNEGYYLPKYSLNKNICNICQISGCKICDDNFGICQECKMYYYPTIDQSTREIVSCELQCELGENDKCSTCETQKGKESQCASCNLGYKLINGKCKKIENSFVGIYNVTSTIKFTRIMCVSENNIVLSDFDMYVNGKKVEPYIDQGRWRSWLDEDYIAYVFPTLGKNEVKIIFNKILTDMKYLFTDCYDLISIEFNETFDTSHVLCMYYMFSSCDLLQKINISSFNTSLVGDMEGMFSGCDSLTSLDLSNFDTKNVNYMQCIFSYSENLSYLDISSFDTTNLAGGGWMFEDLAENGIVIIGNKFNMKSSLPEGWTIINKN